jgi:acetyl esterase/lipase
VPARRPDLAGLPPTFIGVGGIDLFVSEDIAYARRLTEANVATELVVVPGAFHGFDRVAPETRVAQRFTKMKLNALRRAFGQPVVV